MLLKQRRLIKYFQELQREMYEGKPAGLVYQSNVNRQHLICVLLNTKFLKKEKRENEKNTKKRWYAIENIINRCVKDGFFDLYKDRNLTLTIEGEEFVKPLPFLNTVLEKYGALRSAVLAFLLSGLFWAFMFFSTKQIIIFFEFITDSLWKHS